MITAAGVPGLVRGNWLKKDSIAIDVGINFVDVGQNQKKVLCGDIEFNE